MYGDVLHPGHTHRFQHLELRSWVTSHNAAFGLVTTVVWLVTIFSPIRSIFPRWSQQHMELSKATTYIAFLLTCGVVSLLTSSLDSIFSRNI
jgi:hypothetical protein